MIRAGCRASRPGAGRRALRRSAFATSPSCTRRARGPPGLKTIFRTNLRVSAAAARWERIQARKDRFPYLMYDAVRDSRTRPQHLEWDGPILPVDHSFWQTHDPPNGWGYPNLAKGCLVRGGSDLSEDHARQRSIRSQR